MVLSRKKWWIGLGIVLIIALVLCVNKAAAATIEVSWGEGTYFNDGVGEGYQSANYYEAPAGWYVISVTFGGEISVPNLQAGVRLYSETDQTVYWGYNGLTGQFECTFGFDATKGETTYDLRISKVWAAVRSVGGSGTVKSWLISARLREASTNSETTVSFDIPSQPPAQTNYSAQIYDYLQQTLPSIQTSVQNTNNTLGETLTTMQNTYNYLTGYHAAPSAPTVGTTTTFTVPDAVQRPTLSEPTPTPAPGPIPQPQDFVGLPDVPLDEVAQADELQQPDVVPTPDATPELDPVPTVDALPTADPVPATDPIPTADPVPATDPTPTADPVPTTDPTPTADPVPTTDPIPTADPVPTADPIPTADPVPQN